MSYSESAEISGRQWSLDYAAYCDRRKSLTKTACSRALRNRCHECLFLHGSHATDCERHPEGYAILIPCPMSGSVIDGWYADPATLMRFEVKGLPDAVQPWERRRRGARGENDKQKGNAR